MSEFKLYYLNSSGLNFYFFIVVAPLDVPCKIES